MKTIKLNDFLLWKGRLAQCLWETNQRTVGIKYVEHSRCPHCNGELERESFNVIPTSPLFQENAEPIETISQ